MAWYPSVCVLASTAALLAGCASVPAPARGGCAKGETPQVMEALYFGANKPQGVVSPEEWTAFVDAVVTPRFPQGLSVLQAAGQWRNANGVIEREASRVLQIVHEGSARDDAAGGEIVAHYKTQYQQEAVLRMRSGACVSF
jgi:poly(3-hydroxybutyrate) depolymerase